MNRRNWVWGLCVVVAGCNMVVVAPPVDRTGLEATVLAATWQLVLLDMTAVSLADDNGLPGENGSFEGVPLVSATAFAAGEHIFVTNAHVMRGVLDALDGARFPTLIAVQHETGTSVRIDETWIHPGYDPEKTITEVPDVAVLRVEEALPDVLPLADVPRAHALAVGEVVTLCGFPGGLTPENAFEGFPSELRPRAQCSSGLVTELVRIDLSAELLPENLNSVRYGIATEPGSSGSAVVDDAGEVVGVHGFTFVDTGIGGGTRSDEIVAALSLADSGATPNHTFVQTRVFLFCPIGGVVCASDSAACTYDATTGQGEGFDATCFTCDADCDGWSDRSEFEFGVDPCDGNVTPLVVDLAPDVCIASISQATVAEPDDALPELLPRNRSRLADGPDVGDGAWRVYLLDGTRLIEQTSTEW